MHDHAGGSDEAQKVDRVKHPVPARPMTVDTARTWISIGNFAAPVSAPSRRNRAGVNGGCCNCGFPLKRKVTLLASREGSMPASRFLEASRHGVAAAQHLIEITRFLACARKIDAHCDILIQY
jgi:hypothetical protein